jgi:hypothetical protein
VRFDRCPHPRAAGTDDKHIMLRIHLGPVSNCSPETPASLTVRSLLQTYLRWLTRTEKALAREIRIAEDNR